MAGRSGAPGEGADVDAMAEVRRRRRRQVATTLVAGLAVVAVVGVAVPMIVSGGGGDAGSPAPAASASSGPFTGVKWRMVSVADGDGVTPVPVSVGASLELTPGGRLGPSGDGVRYDGSIGLNDGTNYAGGRYNLTANGFETGWIAETAALYAGSDPHRLAAIKAVNAMAFGLEPDRPGSGSVGARTTVVSVTSTTLVVTARGLRVTFERNGSGA